MTTREGQTTRDVPRGQCASPVGRSVSASSPGWRHPSGRGVWSGEIADANAFANVRSFTRSLTAPPKKSAATDAIHFFSVPFANKVGAARARPPSIHPSIHPSHVPNGQFLFPSYPLLSCRLACFRALTSELIISRSAAFLIAVVSPRLRRQSIDQASTTRSPSPDAAGGRLAPVAAATIIFVLIWEEKSRGRKRRTEESSGGGPRTCDPPLVDRTWYLESASSLAVTATAENDGWTIRHLTGAAAGEPDN